MSRQTQNVPHRRCRLIVLAVLSSLLLSSEAAADPPPHAGIFSLPDLRDRASAFRDALVELARAERPPPLLIGGELVMTSEYSLRPGFFDDELGFPMSPAGRDLVLDERILISGREQAHEDAARHWVGRKLKGSGHGGKRSSRVRPRLAWDHGPIAGAAAGPVSFRVGEDHWRVQWKMRRRRPGGPWTTRIRIGETDGELVAAFVVGRSILDAWNR